MTTLGSYSLHLSPSPPADPAGHNREEEWPVLESSGGGRCPTVSQHTPLRARLLPKYPLPWAGKREGNLWHLWVLIFTPGQSKRLMSRTETTGVSLPCQCTLNKLKILATEVNGIFTSPT